MTIRKKQDGLQNVFTNNGIFGKDKKASNTFTARPTLTEHLADDLWGSEGLARRIVELPCYEMLRAGYRVKNTDFMKRMRQLKFVHVINEFLCWDRLFGGAILVAGVKDGGDFNAELKPVSSPSDLLFLRVYSKHRITMPAVKVTDPFSPLFGEPEWVTVNPRGGSQFQLHRSRYYCLKGVLSTDNKKMESFGYWGDSVLTAVLDYIERFIQSHDSCSDILIDFIQTILQIDNLQALIASGQDKGIKKRLELLDMGRSTMNMILLDTKEKYEKSASSVTGIDAVIQEFQVGLAAVTDITITRLFGRSPAGMNATGESDLRNWYDRIKFDQENTLVPIIEWLESICGIESEEAEVHLNPLREETPKEKTENRLRQAQSDQIYYNIGVLAAGEIRDSRFDEEGGYCYETEINPNVMPEIGEGTAGTEPEPIGTEA